MKDNKEQLTNCLCEKHGDLFGCGDGWTICGGFCNTAVQNEDRKTLIQIIERLTLRVQTIDDICERCQERCTHNNE